MKSPTIYAVVDLETTGTSLDGKQRIIQFSCVLVQNNKIINKFNTLVNPQMSIPLEVQKLTNITNKDVKNAPCFDEVVGTIFAFLQGTVFVAHNIQFDYRFLNLEFERVGYPALDLSGIDTVQMAQILLPDLLSYRLIDLGKYLGLTHENPHHADSDALVTAKIFIFLRERLKKLPYILLKRLASMSHCLVYDTNQCFNEALENKSESNEVLANNLMVVGDIVIRRPQFSTPPRTQLQYPTEKKDKQLQFENVIGWRSEQVKLMDDIHTFNQKKQRYLMAEAPTGLGKTLGYMYPCAYEALNGRRVVISTATTTLQNQIKEKTLPVIEQLLGQDFNTVVLKGNNHYIDLDKFWHSLQRQQNKHTKILQMRILVWLTKTKQGDLEELHLTQMNDALFAEIAHTGLQGLSQDSSFYKVDFLRRQQIALQNAQFVITNHAYLLSHAEEFSHQESFLVIDEAQNLIDIAITQNRKFIDFDEIKILADTLLTKMESHISFSFKDLVEHGFLTQYQFYELVKTTRSIDYDVPELRGQLQNYFLDNEKNAFEVYVPFDKLKIFVERHFAQINHIQTTIYKYQQLNNNLRRYFNSNSDNLTVSEQQLLLDYFILVNALNDALVNWQYLILDNEVDKKSAQVYWLSIQEKQNNAHLRLSYGILEGQNYLETQLYAYFNKVILVGASLLTAKTQEYLLKQLDLPDNIEIRKYNSPFDYQNQACTLIAGDALDVSDPNYEVFLAQTLIEIIQAQKRQTLILFNSLETIKHIYTALSQAGLTNEREILAQGITGGVEKIKKHFVLNSQGNSVLLGTGSFWQGIDLPAKQLELLIVTRLPFQAPESLYNKVRYERARKKGANPFSDLALPEAIIKLKQGWGRLIRTPNDKGAFVLLDSRFVTKKYGQEFYQAFPSNLNPQIIKTKDITKKLDTFFIKKSCD